MDKPKQMIVVRRDLKMRKGKIAAQAGHACVTAVLAALEREGRLSQVHAENGGISLLPSGQPATPLSEWFARGVAKVCLYVDSEEALLAVDRRAKEAGLISALASPSSTANRPIPVWRLNLRCLKRWTRSPESCRCSNMRTALSRWPLNKRKRIAAVRCVFCLLFAQSRFLRP